jgi:hypothetical protein
MFKCRKEENTHCIKDVIKMAPYAAIVLVAIESVREPLYMARNEREEVSVRTFLEKEEKKPDVRVH